MKTIMCGILAVILAFTFTACGNDDGGGDPYNPGAGAGATQGLVYELINSGSNANTYRVRAGTVTSGAVVIPSTYSDKAVTEIGSADDDTGAFKDTGITSITIPSSVTAIGQAAFQNCANLTSITIPSSVKSIGDYAFGWCTGITGIIIPAGVTSIGDSTFNNCANLASVTIPAGVTSIGHSAFYECGSLTNITIPSSVRSIGDWAFASNSSSSLNITCRPTMPPTLAAQTVFEQRNLTIEVPAASVNAYKTSAVWINYADDISAIVE